MLLLTDQLPSTKKFAIDFFKLIIKLNLRNKHFDAIFRVSTGNVLCRFYLFQSRYYFMRILNIKKHCTKYYCKQLFF